MKLKKIIAGLAVSVMLCTAVMSSAGAYFTDYDGSKGENPFTYKVETELHEHVSDHKELQINNTGEIAVTIRARAFAGAEYADILDYEGEGWTDGGDGWWYYGPEVAPGEATTTLYISVDLPTTGVEAGQDVNVVVVYEATPVDGGAA